MDDTKCSGTLVSPACPFSAVAAWAEPASPPADPQLNARAGPSSPTFKSCKPAQTSSWFPGQFCSFGSSVRLDAAENVFKATGRWPALISVDYADFKGNWLDTHTPNRLMIDLLARRRAGEHQRAPQQPGQGRRRRAQGKGTGFGRRAG